MRHILRVAIEDSDPTIAEFRGSFAKMLGDNPLASRTPDQDAEFNNSVMADLEVNLQEQEVIDNQLGDLLDMRDAVADGGTLKMESIGLDLSTLLQPLDEEGEVDQAEATRLQEVALEGIGTAISEGVKKAWAKIIEFCNKVIAWFKVRAEYNKRHRDWNKFSKYNFGIDALAHRYLSETKFEDVFKSELMPTLSRREQVWVGKVPDELKQNVDAMEWMSAGAVDNYLKALDSELEEFKRDAGNDERRMTRLEDNIKHHDRAMAGADSSAKLNRAFKAFGEMDLEFDFNDKTLVTFLNTLDKRKAVADKLMRPVMDYNPGRHIQMLTGYKKDLEEASKDPTNGNGLGLQKVRDAQIKFLVAFFRGMEEIQQDIFALYSAAHKVGNWVIKVIDEEITDIKRDPKSPGGAELEITAGPRKGEKVTTVEFYQEIKKEMAKFLSGIPQQ